VCHFISLTIAVFCFALAFVASAPGQDQLLREAARLDAEQKCDQAEIYYRQALAKGSPSPALLNNLGNHSLICGQPVAARSYFERLVWLNPLHVNGNLQLARLAIEEKQGSKALEYLARIKNSDPAIILLRAEASHWAGQPAAATANLDAVEKGAKSDPRLLFLLGMTCARIGLYDRAEAAFNGALAGRPEDFDILFNLGRAAARVRHFDRAQRALEAALRMRPDDLDTLFELGLVFAACSDYSRAVYLLAQARQKAPGRPDLLLALARAAEDAGYYGDAALAYDDYLRLRPDDDGVRRDHGRVCGYTDTRLAEGLKELAWYIEKYPSDPLGHYALAQISWKDTPEQALDHLSTAARLDPASVPIRCSRAWLLNRLGRLAEALADLDVAVKIEPGNLRALDQLGLIRLSLDQPEEAEKVLRQALAIAPEDPDVLLHLGRTVMALGHEEEAQVFLEKFQKIRPQRVLDSRKEAGMIELAVLSAAERRQHEIERFRRDSHEHPDHPVFQLHFASLLLADGRLEEAAREFRVLLGRNADSTIWMEAGATLLRAGQYELARDFLQRAVAERPAARLDLAITLFLTGGPEQALQVLDQIPEGERTGDSLLLKANVLDAAGRGPEAEKALDEGLRRSASQPQVAKQAALMLLRHQRKEAALELLGQAIRNNPDNSDLLLTQVIVLGLMDRNSVAEKTLKEIESQWPEWDRAYLVHGLLLEHCARTGEARQKLQTAIALGSRDPILHCALARLAGVPHPSPECACLTGLEQLLIPGCIQ
jgi:tetratricopeptide (TPR) repeat protein